MFNYGVLKTDELHLVCPWLVPGNIELVNIRVRAESSQLEIHLLRVLTAAKDEVTLGVMVLIILHFLELEVQG